ncbi:MAG TPA: vWA domain-containing protein [Candidatus Acidoferrales bacterium]|nr:vWA domain-containing protein [Candidatus Acidoferrales bacterium]
MLKSRLANALALLFCLCVSTCPANAQAPETHVVPVTVVTTDGKPVTSLQSQNIRVREHGVQVKSFSLDAGPRRIVLLMDISGSMGTTDHGKLRLIVALELMKLFLNSVSKGNSLSLYQFGDSPREIVPFTHDVDAIRQAIDSVSALRENEMVGLTNIGDALNAILMNSQEPLAFGDSIVMFTDGEFNSDNGKQHAFSSFAPALARRGVRVFLVLTQERGTTLGGAQNDSTSVRQAPPASSHLPIRGQFSVPASDGEMAVINDSELFAAGTGGESFAPFDYSSTFQTSKVFRSDDLPQRMKALSAAVQNTYRLEMQFSKPLNRKIRLHLEVMDEQSKALHNVTVLSPDFVYPDAGARH